jgi:2-polyprenyl-3-methyl-5-hydroxy-6-metoxy-1,4-benzoquinol methylase
MRNEIADAVELHSRGAEEFDARYRTRPDFRERYEIWTRLIAKYSSPESRVIDIGCGSGVLSFEAARRNKTVLGIDGSAEMVGLCKSKQAEQDIPNAAFIQSRIENLLELRFASADLLLCSSVLEYMEDLGACLGLLRSLLSPKGIMLVSLPNGASIYRKLERLSYRLIGKPAYVRFMRHHSTPAALDGVSFRLGLKPLETHYYGRRLPLLRSWTGLAPGALGTSLFVCVYQVTEPAISLPKDRHVSSLGRCKC